MAVTIVPGVEVPASRPTSVLPYGLFSVAPVLPLDRSVAVEWENRVCVEITETASECFTGDPADPKTFDGRVLWQVENPFTLFAATDCIGGDAARVADKIVASEQFGVERWFHANILNRSPDSAGAAVEPLEAIALLEQELGERYGTAGVIHMSRYLFTLAKPKTEVANGVLRTDLGTLIAAGGGYPNDGSMYGTGPVRVFRGDVVSANAFDRESNENIHLGERDYVVAADLCDAAVEVSGIVVA